MAGIRWGMGDGCSQRTASRSQPRCKRAATTAPKSAKAQRNRAWRRSLGVSGRARFAAIDRIRVLLNTDRVAAELPRRPRRRGLARGKSVTDAGFFCVRRLRWVAGKIAFVFLPTTMRKIVFFPNSRRDITKDRRLGPFACCPMWLCKPL